MEPPETLRNHAEGREPTSLGQHCRECKTTAARCRPPSEAARPRLRSWGRDALGPGKGSPRGARAPGIPHRSEEQPRCVPCLGLPAANLLPTPLARTHPDDLLRGSTDPAGISGWGNVPSAHQAARPRSGHLLQLGPGPFHSSLGRGNPPAAAASPHHPPGTLQGRDQERSELLVRRDWRQEKSAVPHPVILGGPIPVPLPH